MRGVHAGAAAANERECHGLPRGFLGPAQKKGLQLENVERISNPSVQRRIGNPSYKECPSYFCAGPNVTSCGARNMKDRGARTVAPPQHRTFCSVGVDNCSGFPFLRMGAYIGGGGLT